MALEESLLFRQLEQGGRFSRFDYLDAVLVLLPFNVHYLVALIAGWSLGPPWVTLVAAATFVWFLRARFPDGVAPLIHVLVTPRHLSAHASDQVTLAYPARSRA